ncbi:MAG: CRTAC1 family protein [Anaerolineae bacterium]
MTRRTRTIRAGRMTAALGLAAALAACGGAPAATETTAAPTAAAAAPTPQQGGDAGAPMQRVDVPPDLEPHWLEGRRQDQLATRDASKVVRDFAFTDRQPESGITFMNRIVDDAGKTFKSVHYDHGCAIAVADVDGDGLTDIYFVRQVGPNELWRNLGGGRFEDITAQAGVAVPDKIGSSAAFADIDNDGDADLYTTSVKKGNLLYENDGKGRFTDITAASGLGYVGHSSGAVFFDYDRDGKLDMFLANVGRYTTDVVRIASTSLPGVTLPRGELEFFDGVPDGFGSHLIPDRTERSLLFHNDGGNRFTDVTDAVGMQANGWTGDASAVDGNEDGWPDLYVLNMQGNDDYFVNEGGKRFVNERESVFPKTPWGSMGIKTFDLDNDGHLDIFLTDMHSDMSQLVNPDQEKLKSDIQFPEDFLATNGTSIFGNAFFKNDGGGRFTEVSDAIGAETFWPWGPSVGDVNADGFEDAFVTASMGYSFRYGINSLLINDGGKKLLDSEFILGVEPRRGGQYAAPQFDIDCDGADRDHDLCKGHGGRATVWGALSTKSSAIFDLEGDGDLDIVTNEFNNVPQVLTSDLAQVRPATTFLRVRLKGTASNRDGLGAKVSVVAGGRRIVQANDGNTGYLSHGLLPLYFGLDGAAAADSIEVEWPSGRKQTVAGPFDAKTTVEVEETAG